MIKVEILEALPELSAEERQEIRAKLNELDNESWSDNGEISEREKAIIEARLDEYDQNPETGSSWEEAKARVVQNEFSPAVRLAVEADLPEAAEWYDQRQPGLGEKFVREVDQAITRVVENPLAFPVILKRHGVRRELTMQYKLKKNSFDRVYHKF
jgi:hypothetical protein